MKNASKYSPSPAIEEIFTGRMAYCFKIKLDAQDENKGVFYVKFSHPDKNFRSLDIGSNKDGFLDKIFEREFLLLELLNLLGVKTPTEIALLNYKENGSIIIKRAAGDSEGRKEVTESDRHSNSYQTRLNTLINILELEDTSSENDNAIAVSGHKSFSHKKRDVLIDPMLGVARTNNSSKADMFSSLLVDEKGFTAMLPSLQKISYFYRLNQEMITPILEDLDYQFDCLLGVLCRKVRNFRRPLLSPLYV